MMSYLDTIDTLVKEMTCLKQEIRSLRFQVSRLEDRVPSEIATLRCEPAPVVCSSCTYFGRNGCPDHCEPSPATPRQFTCILG